MKRFVFLIGLLFLEVASASGDEHGGTIPYKVIVFQLINFSILVGILLSASRKKVAAFLMGRAENHNQAKILAKKAMEEAEEKHREVSFRLRCLQDTEESSIEKAKNDALELKSKLIKEAELIARRLVEDAKKTAQHERERAGQQIEKEALDLALAVAKKSVETGLAEQDQKNLQKQFVESIGAAK